MAANSSDNSRDPQAGDQAPDFDLPTDTDTPARLAAFSGQKVVLFFYPKDDTSGCTKEAIGFTENKAAFDDAETVVIGISADSPKRHQKFRTKHNLDVILGSDEDKVVLEKYGVWVEKSMYGRKYMGIERSTFLIDSTGKIAQVWRKVKVPGHVEAVLLASQGLGQDPL